MLPRFSRKGAYRPLVDAEPAAAYFRRHILLLFVGVTTTAACIFLYTAQLVDLWTSIEDPPPPGTRLPPLYSDYHASELQLPQQDWGRTSPADDEKFFFVAGHVRGTEDFISFQLLHPRPAPGGILHLSCSRVYWVLNRSWLGQCPSRTFTERVPSVSF